MMVGTAFLTFPFLDAPDSIAAFAVSLLTFGLCLPSCRVGRICWWQWF